ncbi:MAG: FliH/SctL family protein [Alphaproteobacteria bacterium]
MAEIRKFMFDLDFEDPAVKFHRHEEPVVAEEEVEAEPEPPPPPTFSEEELATARDDAFAAGRAAGLQEAAEDIEHQVALALDAIGSQMAGLTADLDRITEDNAAAAVNLAVAILRKILPAHISAYGFDEIVALVNQCLPHVLDQPRLIVRAHGAYVEPLSARLQQLAAANGFEGRLIMMPSDEYGPADCRVEWTDGGVDRDTTRLWDDIMAIVVRYMGDHGLTDETTMTEDAGTGPE